MFAIDRSYGVRGNQYQAMLRFVTRWLSNLAETRSCARYRLASVILTALPFALGPPATASDLIDSDAAPGTLTQEGFKTHNAKPRADSGQLKVTTRAAVCSVPGQLVVRLRDANTDELLPGANVFMTTDNGISLSPDSASGGVYFFARVRYDFAVVSITSLQGYESISKGVPTPCGELTSVTILLELAEVPDSTEDLSVSSISASCETGFVGTDGTIDVSLSIHNGGNSNSGAFNVDVYLSINTTISTGDIKIGEVRYGSVFANSSSETNQTYDTCSVPSGTYYIGAIADADNERNETNESNNTGSGNQTAAPCRGCTLDTVYVDFNFSGAENGFEQNPYNTLTEALGMVTLSGAGEIILASGDTDETFIGAAAINPSAKITLTAVLNNIIGDPVRIGVEIAPMQSESRSGFVSR